MREKNIMGLMPHPERATDLRSRDGLKLWKSVTRFLHERNTMSVRIPDSTISTLEMARAIGLSSEEYFYVCRKLDRKPNYAELGIFSAMFSEHCSYKSSKPLLRKFPTTGKASPPRPRRKRRHHQYRRRLGDCFQDGESQSPFVQRPPSVDGCVQNRSSPLPHMLTGQADNRKSLAVASSLRFVRN